MDNANKALIMAGSTLIAVMLFTLFSVFLKDISIWPESQDEILKTEQIEAFNREYEVYQKTGMYGVDVISCLNKAYSNNKKYAEGGYFSDGGYGTNYLIDVTVKIKEPLTESITITAYNYSDLSNREKAIYGESNTVQVKNETGIIQNGKVNSIFYIPDDKKVLTNFDGKPLKYEMSSENDDIKIGTTYELLGSNGELEELIAHSSEARQIVKNKKDNKVYNPSESKYGWVTATWDTYLYSFKQKKFKCVNLEYNSETGLVSKIEFEEI